MFVAKVTFGSQLFNVGNDNQLELLVTKMIILQTNYL